jgi:predicted nucleic-acid-binding protein
MIAVDTNVLVRLVAADDKAQLDAAVALVREQAARHERLWVSKVVLCEFVWVLGRAYGHRRSRIAEALAGILRLPHFVVEDAAAVAGALARFETGRGDFADYLIAESASRAGCRHVATFDKALLREDGFVAP